MGEIELSEVQLKILKYMYDYDEEIAQTRGWTSHKIIRCAGVEKREGKAAILFLADIGFVLKEVKKYSRSTGYRSKSTDTYKVPERISGEEEKFRISPKGRKFVEEEQKILMRTEESRSKLEEDIEKLKSATEEEAYAIFYQYKEHVKGVDDTLTYSSSFAQDLMNILVGYRDLLNQEERDMKTPPTTVIYINNIINNDISINIALSQVRSEIVQAYTGEEQKEILERIDEIEKINQEEKDKNQKWQKLKGVFDWITKQGVDIAIKLLPLILKMIAEG